MASHRIIQWVTKTLGINAAENMYADLNRRHFEDGQKLNDPEMLVKVLQRLAPARQVVFQSSMLHG